jgi:ATP-binding cassette subfamily B protein
MTLTFYSFFIFGPLQEIGNIILSYREAEASLNNFHNLMQKPSEPKPASPKAIGPINAICHLMIFALNTSLLGFYALDGISFQVKKGETIAFVGPSGAGKSTLVKLLVGLYHTQDGIGRLQWHTWP